MNLRYKLSVDVYLYSRQTVCMNTEQTAFLNQFGKRIADIRKQNNLTQEQLADLVDLHRTYIGFIEQGKRNPSIANVYKIAKALGVELNTLFS